METENERSKPLGPAMRTNTCSIEYLSRDNCDGGSKNQMSLESQRSNRKRLVIDLAARGLQAKVPSRTKASKFRRRHLLDGYCIK